MTPDPVFWGLTSTQWTALAAIAAAFSASVALLYPIIGAGIKALYARLRAPALFIDFAAIDTYSSEYNQGYWFRIPVRNKAKRRPAKNVRVFVRSLTTETATGETQQTEFVPMCLRWCHGTSPVIDSISGGEFRLLDFGVMDIHSEEVAIFSGTPRQLVISGEVSAAGNFIPATGTYRVHLTISAEGITPFNVTAQVAIHADTQPGALPAKIVKAPK